MNYEVEIDKFQGPLEKLLELVRDEELDINLVSLSKVTEGFLKYLEELREEDVPHRILADFLVIASKLLLIKSKVIIPTLDFDEEEEEDMEELKLQLKLYDKIKEATEHIEENWNEAPTVAHREFLMTKETFFHPPENLEQEDMLNSLMGVLEEIEKLKPVEKIEKKIISLQDRIKDLLGDITGQMRSVSEFKKKSSKDEIVVLFLAVLHLFKDQLIEVEQEGSFGDIKLSSKNDN